MDNKTRHLFTKLLLGLFHREAELLIIDGSKEELVLIGDFGKELISYLDSIGFKMDDIRFSELLKESYDYLKESEPSEA